MSGIEWTDKTWNPIAGCDPVSPGCDNCYAVPIARRCEGFGHEKYLGTTCYTSGGLAWSGHVTFDASALEIPRRIKTPTIWFVNSMADIGHHKVTDEQVAAIFDVMNRTPHHHYQLLTKRPHRIVKMADRLSWTPNIWFGVSAENMKHGAPRVRDLRKLPAAIRFISAEPLLEDVSSLDLTDIHWVIAGGESGRSPDYIRQMDRQWARNLRDKCKSLGVPYFFKQWGNWDEHGRWQRSKKDAGHLLDGVEHFEMPAVVKKAMAKPNRTTLINTVQPAAPTVVAAAPQSPGRIAYRDMILARLQSGPMAAAELRNQNGATGRVAGNLHAWALVDLQKERKITKRRDGRYSLLIRIA